MTSQNAAIANLIQSTIPAPLLKATTRKHYRIMKQRFLGVILALCAVMGCIIAHDFTVAVLLVPVAIWLIASKKYILTDIKRRQLL